MRKEGLRAVDPEVRHERPGRLVLLVLPFLLSRLGVLANLLVVFILMPTFLPVLLSSFFFFLNFVGSSGGRRHQRRAPRPSVVPLPAIRRLDRTIPLVHVEVHGHTGLQSGPP